MATKKYNKKDLDWCRETILKVFDALDKSGTNLDYYKAKLAGMDDDEFFDYVSQKFPYRFHEKPFVTKPTMKDISNALAIIGVPLLERISLPYLYENDKGAVMSKKCYVGYLTGGIKKVQQFITKKNSMSTDIATRDMKTGLLTGHDKNGKATDREMESLAIMGLDACMEEFARPRADAMDAKTYLYSTINTTGDVSLKDIPKSQQDSLARNLVDVYFTGAFIKTNLISDDYMLPYTLSDKKQGIGRL